MTGAERPGRALQQGRAGAGDGGHVTPAHGSQGKGAGARAPPWGRGGALPDTPTPWLQPRAPPISGEKVRLCVAKFQ